MLFIIKIEKNTIYMKQNVLYNVFFLILVLFYGSKMTHLKKTLTIIIR